MSYFFLLEWNEVVQNNEVKKEVDNINTLPNDAEKPKIFEVNVSEIPIIDVNIQAPPIDKG